MANEDVSLTFDPRPFEGGFKRIEQRMVGLQSIAANTGRMVTRSILKAAAVISVVGVGIKGLISVVKTHMPEIGQTFQIASNIFFNNLLFPLRQALLPLLQRFLEWTRDHRAMFVQWGQVLVTVFRTLWTIGRTAFDVIKGLVQNLFPRFAEQARTNFIGLIQMFLFKVMFLVQAVSVLLGDFIKAVGPGIGDILRSLWQVAEAIGKIAWDLLVGFFKGIAENAPKIEAAFHALASGFDALGKALASISGGSIQNLGKTLGAAFSGGLITALNTVALLLTVIADAIGFITGQHPDWSNLLPLLKGIGQGITTVPGVTAIGKEAEALGKGTLADITKLGQGAYGLVQNLVKEGKGAIGVHDAVITPRGQVVRLDPSDYVFATRSPGRTQLSLAGAGMSLSVNLNVTEGNARQAGERFGESFARSLKRKLLDEAVGAGW